MKHPRTLFVFAALIAMALATGCARDGGATGLASTKGAAIGGTYSVTVFPKRTSLVGSPGIWSDDEAFSIRLAQTVDGLPVWAEVVVTGGFNRKWNPERLLRIPVALNGEGRYEALDAGDLAGAAIAPSPTPGWLESGAASQTVSEAGEDVATGLQERALEGDRGSAWIESSDSGIYRMEGSVQGEVQSAEGPLGTRASMLLYISDSVRSTRFYHIVPVVVSPSTEVLVNGTAVAPDSDLLLEIGGKRVSVLAERDGSTLTLTRLEVSRQVEELWQ